MRVQYSAAAEAELAEALDWYAACGPELAQRFLNEVNEIERAAAEHPRAWPEVEPGVRRVVLRKFPFALLYRSSAEGLQILAVAHQRRRPGHWRRRSS